jgi:hypothetical protein
MNEQRKINEVAQPDLKPSCNQFETNLVSRKAVREMVARWSYDMAEWEDVELALHDVDGLPPVQPEVTHCKYCKHYRTTDASGAPLNKEEYFCDADNHPHPKDDPNE